MSSIHFAKASRSSFGGRVTSNLFHARTLSAAGSVSCSVDRGEDKLLRVLLGSPSSFVEVPENDAEDLGDECAWNLNFLFATGILQTEQKMNLKPPSRQNWCEHIILSPCLVSLDIEKYADLKSDWRQSRARISDMKVIKLTP